MTHGHELRGRNASGWGFRAEGNKGEKINGTIVIAESVKYI